MVKTGIFVSLLTLVLMVVVATVGKESGLFEGKSPVRAHVLNAQNLKTGAAVELKGLRVGHVTSVRIVSQDTVEVELEVRSSELPWVRKDTRMAISNAGLVGDKYVELVGGSEAAGPYDPRKDVLMGEAPMDFKQIAAKGGNIAETADRVLLKLEAIVDRIPGAKLERAVDGFAAASAKLAPAVDNVGRAAARLDSVMARLEKGPGTAHSLVYDDQLYEDLRKLLGGAERNNVIKYFIRESIKKASKPGDQP